MSVRTIEQKMNAASLWNGAAPSGGLNRSITHDAADNVVAATRVWQFTNGAFSAADVGRLLQVGGTGSGNDGTYTIEQVNGATEIVTTESPTADETFGGGVTQEVYEASAAPTAGSDMESYPEGVNGGLFDFENDNPITVKQIAIAFGSGTTSWKLELIDKDAVPVEVKAGTSLTYFANFASGEAGAGLILLEGQKLKLTSVGGPTTAARARVTVSSQVE